MPRYRVDGKRYRSENKRTLVDCCCPVIPCEALIDYTGDILLDPTNLAFDLQSLVGAGGCTPPDDLCDSVNCADIAVPDTLSYVSPGYWRSADFGSWTYNPDCVPDAEILQHWRLTLGSELCEWVLELWDTPYSGGVPGPESTLMAWYGTFGTPASSYELPYLSGGEGKRDCCLESHLPSVPSVFIIIP